MVALYFLSVALGTAMAGQLAGYYDATDEQPFFLWIGLASVVTGVVCSRRQADPGVDGRRALTGHVSAAGSCRPGT